MLISYLGESDIKGDFMPSENIYIVQKWETALNM